MNATTTADRLLDEREAADLLHINHRTLANWRVRGGGPRFVKIGRLVRYRAGDISDWIEGRTSESTSDADRLNERSDDEGGEQ
jgi:predicted DNA-binding transcriptional regulator AlpA